MSLIVDLSNVKPGMILAEDVYWGKKLLLAGGSIIKSSYIGLLREHRVPRIWIYEQIQPNDVLSNPVEASYEKAYRAIGEIMDSLGSDKPVDASQIFPIVESMMETVFSNRDFILLLTGYKKTFDIYNYTHSLDVCIYSLITAKAMGLNYEECVTLALGALLHDIGKSKVPGRILSKQTSLTVEEFEEVKKHSDYGYHMAMEILPDKPDVARIVLEHHERCNGCGYPNNLRGNEIHKLSKIVAIADIYDALTSDRIYRKKVLPHEAAEYLLSISNSQLDCDIANIFLRNIAIYPKGCQVLLNTNEVALVVDSNARMPLRPMLKILTDRKRNFLQLPHELNLESNLSVFITHIFG